MHSNTHLFTKLFLISFLNGAKVFSLGGRTGSSAYRFEALLSCGDEGESSREPEVPGLWNTPSLDASGLLDWGRGALSAGTPPLMLPAPMTSFSVASPENLTIAWLVLAAKPRVKFIVAVGPRLSCPLVSLGFWLNWLGLVVSLREKEGSPRGFVSSPLDWFAEMWPDCGLPPLPRLLSPLLTGIGSC